MSTPKKNFLFVIPQKGKQLSILQIDKYFNQKKSPPSRIALGAKRILVVFFKQEKKNKFFKNKQRKNKGFRIKKTIDGIQCTLRSITTKEYRRFEKQIDLIEIEYYLGGLFLHKIPDCIEKHDIQEYFQKRYQLKDINIKFLHRNRHKEIWKAIVSFKCEQQIKYATLQNICSNSELKLEIKGEMIPFSKRIKYDTKKLILKNDTLLLEAFSSRIRSKDIKKWFKGHGYLIKSINRDNQSTSESFNNESKRNFLVVLKKKYAFELYYKKPKFKISETIIKVNRFYQKKNCKIKIINFSINDEDKIKFLRKIYNIKRNFYNSKDYRENWTMLEKTLKLTADFMKLNSSDSVFNLIESFRDFFNQRTYHLMHECRLFRNQFIHDQKKLKNEELKKLTEVFLQTINWIKVNFDREHTLKWKISTMDSVTKNSKLQKYNENTVNSKVSKNRDSKKPKVHHSSDSSDSSDSSVSNYGNNSNNDDYGDSDSSGGSDYSDEWVLTTNPFAIKPKEKRNKNNYENSKKKKKLKNKKKYTKMEKGRYKHKKHKHYNKYKNKLISKRGTKKKKSKHKNKMGEKNKNKKHKHHNHNKSKHKLKFIKKEKITKHKNASISSNSRSLSTSESESEKSSENESEIEPESESVSISENESESEPESESVSISESESESEPESEKSSESESEIESTSENESENETESESVSISESESESEPESEKSSESESEIESKSEKSSENETESEIGSESEKSSENESESESEK
ncbi:hypothetical protein M0813_09562 [Anaeramoeba flamelloides]|uniref:Uncharacterized protein n=1 Tax=Anaeramoeba flamelloides TaxID=1746091 RepID=A0ABQ8X6C2_9EUKA|nr:hypothetical protein M0813_09562 [Anaeramoeba flamelloides]